jgi:hypothetical protein
MVAVAVAVQMVVVAQSVSFGPETLAPSHQQIRGICK